MSRRRRVLSLVALFVIGQATFVSTSAINTEFTLADILIIVVDLLVLVVIILEWLWSYKREKLRDSREAGQDQRQADLQKIVAVLSEFMFDGYWIAEAIPEPTMPTNFKRVLEWEKSVKDWEHKVSQSLLKLSRRAASAFLLVTPSSVTDNLVRLPSGKTYVVTAERDKFIKRCSVS
jgi:hypothetical protein